MSKHKNKKREPMSKLKLGLVIGIPTVVVIAAVVVGVLLYINRQNGEEGGPTAESTAASKVAVEKATTDGTLQEQARKELADTTAREVPPSYEKAINEQAEVNRKIELYVDLANIYYADDKPDKAIAVAKRAEALSSDKFMAADWLARAYEDGGDYPNALAYYKIAADGTDSPQNVARMNKTFYTESIDRVTKLIQGSAS